MRPDENRLLVWRWMNAWAVRKGDFKLTNMNNVFGKGPYPSDQYIQPIQNDNSLKLFNLNQDPGERINLVNEMPLKADELKKAYENWLNENSGKF